MACGTSRTPQTIDPILNIPEPPSLQRRSDNAKAGRQVASHQRMLAFRFSLRHLIAMHRRLVFEEPISRAALWSRRLIWFTITVVLLALLIFRLGEPSLQGLTPIAGAYGLVLLALLMAVLAFMRIWQAGHRGVGMAAQAFVL